MAATVLGGVASRLGTITEVLAAAAGALAGSQFSLYLQHYVQNLAGRLAEARAGVEGIIERSRAAGMPVYAYLEEFASAVNPVFRREGEALQEQIDRAGALSAAYHDLARAGLLERPLAFLAHVDREIAADAWRHFEPALPVDAASLAYAAMALLLVLLAWHGLRLVLIAPFAVARRMARPRRVDKGRLRHRP